MALRGVVLALITSCGDSMPPAFDAGADAPERCARTRDRYHECGVCIEPHATLIGTSGRDGRLYPVEGGVLFTSQTQLDVVYVNDAGEVVDAFSEVPDDLGANMSWLELVPGTRQVWGIANLFGPGLDRDQDEAQVVLLDVSDSAITRLSSVRLRARVGAAAALDSGELILSAHDTLTDDGTLTACASEGGEVVCRVIDTDTEIGDRVAAIWGLSDRRAVIATKSPGDSRGWVSVLDLTLGLLSEPAAIHAETAPEYEVGNEPGIRTEPAGAFAVHRDTTASILLRGTLAGMDASPFSHYFVRRLDDTGEFLDPAPGIWVNPDAFAFVWDEPEPLVTGGIKTAPENATRVTWRTESSPNFEFLQLIDSSGIRVFPSSLRDELNTRDVAVPAFIDGADRAFSHSSVLTRSNPERAFESRFGVDLVTDNLEYVWAEPLFYQGCDRVDEQTKAVTGAHDDGVWVVWLDVVIGGVDGLPYTQLKIARVMPDGDFGWRFDE